jgi:hypothetical protein
MTTFTNNLNEELFTDLSSTEAEAIQGGWDFTGYDEPNQKGKVIGVANFALPELGEFDNRMESVNITGGTWRLYDGSNYNGDYIELSKGKYNLKNYSFQYPQTGDPAISAANHVSSLKQVD